MVCNLHQPSLSQLSWCYSHSVDNSVARQVKNELRRIPTELRQGPRRASQEEEMARCTGHAPVGAWYGMVWHGFKLIARSLCSRILWACGSDKSIKAKNVCLICVWFVWCWCHGLFKSAWRIMQEILPCPAGSFPLYGASLAGTQHHLRRCYAGLSGSTTLDLGVAASATSRRRVVGNQPLGW